MIRYPGSIDALRSRVARLYGLWGPTTKISYIVPGDERNQKVPLKCQVRRSMPLFTLSPSF